MESELQHIYHIDKSINERLRSHHAIDSEMEREIIELKRQRRDEKKKEYQKWMDCGIDVMIEWKK